MLRPKSAHPLYNRSVQSLSSNNSARFTNRFIFSQSAFDDIYHPQSEKKCKVITGPSLFYNVYKQKNYHNYIKQQRINTVESSSGFRKSNKKIKNIKLKPSKPLSSRSLSTLKSQLSKMRQATQQIQQVIYITQKMFYKKKNRISTSQLYSHLAKSCTRNKKQSIKSVNSQFCEQMNKQNCKISANHITEKNSNRSTISNLKIEAFNIASTSNNDLNYNHKST